MNSTGHCKYLLTFSGFSFSNIFSSFNFKSASAKSTRSADSGVATNPPGPLGDGGSDATGETPTRADRFGPARRRLDLSK